MKSEFQITPQAWMISSESTALMKALHRGSSTPRALFVGGCVRDAVIGKSVKDIDIATSLVPEETIKICEEAGFKVIPTGIDHGTVTVVINKQVYEVTTLRRDVSTDGRRAIVAFSDDWHEDVMRRDFTMNTLLADCEGNIYDFTERGIEDLKAGHVIFVGIPSQRIAEDYLRILRFFRFYADYGFKNEPDLEALKACRDARDKIETLSRERISQEFFKIVLSDNAAKTLRIMFKNNLMIDVFGDDFSFDGFQELIRRQKEYGAVNLEGRLFALSKGRLDHLLSLEQKYFVFTNAQKKFLQQLAQINQSSETSPQRIIYDYGKEAAAQHFIRMDLPHLEQNMSFLKNWQVPAFPLGGEDLKILGIKQGKEVGVLLKQVEEWWVNKEFLPDKQACLDYLKTLIS